MENISAFPLQIMVPCSKAAKWITLTKLITPFGVLFSQSTKYFEPSERDFMINYRVENIEALVEELKSAGVTILDEIATYDYGKFVHILDPEGNKIELFEPAGE